MVPSASSRVSCPLRHDGADPHRWGALASCKERCALNCGPNPKASVLFCELSSGHSPSGLLCTVVSHFVAFLTLGFRGRLRVSPCIDLSASVCFGVFFFFLNNGFMSSDGGPLCFVLFCFFNLFIFIYLWLCWVFVSVRGLSPVVASGGPSSSRCAGLSLSRPLLLRSTGSRHAGSVIVAHGPSCSAACGIFPDQGSNPCPLHWQADSQPLRHQGSPAFGF